MNTGPVTLTREEWDKLWEGLDEIRDRMDHLYELTDALTVLGFDKPAGIIDAVHEEIVGGTIRLQGVLVEADDERPLARASTLHAQLLRKWLWPLNKSNREA